MESSRYQAVATVMEENNGFSDFSKKLYHQTSLSSMEINLEEFHKSLASVSTFATRRQEQLQPLIIYEITSFGESNYKSMTLRELLLYVNRGADEIDQEVPKNPKEVVDAVATRDFRSTETDLPRVYEIELEKVRTPTRRRASSENKTIASHQSPPSSEEATLKEQNPLSLIHPLGQEKSQRHSSVASPLFEEVVPTAVKSLRLRDLRRLDSNTSTLNDTAIVVKRHAVIFAMDPICAVIMADRLLLVVPEGADSLLGILNQYMREWVESHQPLPLSVGTSRSLQGSGKRKKKQQQRRLNVDYLLTPDISFEAHAYEALLMTVKEVESQQVDFLVRRLEQLLRHYRQGTLIPWPIQSELRQVKNDLSEIGSRLRGVAEALQHVSEDEEEMALMNLSALRKKPSLYQFPLEKEILLKHDEIEELVEFYLSDLRAISLRIENAQLQVQNAMELVSVRLDTAQNQLLLANTALLIVNCAIVFGSYITGVFGMNLDQTIYIQPVNGGFAYVSSGSFGVMFLVFGAIFGYLKYAQVLPQTHSLLLLSSEESLLSWFRSH